MSELENSVIEAARIPRRLVREWKAKWRKQRGVTYCYATDVDVANTISHSDNEEQIISEIGHMHDIRERESKDRRKLSRNFNEAAASEQSVR